MFATCVPTSSISGITSGQSTKWWTRKYVLCGKAAVCTTSSSDSLEKPRVLLHL
ncbi:hypothetical protein DPMN_171466 [Dreissena polymorpha]|uniref:Uncharacterized protein n=1 Tax=Dreissena polymorpha TaxID=45954 RepID=A0A9D4DZ76_DREPO|nr:hypothetical protein DPMN_171466 [Dreissena polymorpha]